MHAPKAAGPVPAAGAPPAGPSSTESFHFTRRWLQRQAELRFVVFGSH